MNGTCERAAARATLRDLALCAILTAVVPVIAVAADPASEPRLLTQKLRLVDALLERARTRLPGDPDARATLEIAQTLANVARADLQAHDHSEAAQALDEALRLVSAVSRNNAASSTTLWSARYATLLESMAGLRAALDAIAEEKGTDTAGVLDTGRVDLATARARAQAAAGRYQRAVDLLQAAYDEVVSALVSVRGNETLEHRLVFASPREEFEYEQDRFRSTEILLRLLVEERAIGGGARASIRDRSAQATALAAQAQALAKTGDYAGALEIQEGAVGELAAALRHAGVFIAQ